MVRFKGYLLVAAATLLVSLIINPVQSGQAVARTVQKVFAADVPMSAPIAAPTPATTTARPFQAQAQLPFQFPGGQPVTGTTTIAVPAGYRLFIQSASVGANVANNNQSVGLYGGPAQVTTIVNGSPASFYVTSTAPYTSVQWYADGGTNIVITGVAYSAPSGSANLLVNISGYLLPMP